MSTQGYTREDEGAAGVTLKLERSFRTGQRSRLLYEEERRRPRVFRRKKGTVKSAGDV